MARQTATKKQPTKHAQTPMRLRPTQRSYLIVTLSLAVALILSVVPVPEWAIQFRPDWVGLVLIYWCLAMPSRVGIGTGFLVGLIQDILYGSLLGQYALSKTVIAFIAVRLHLRIRIFPAWQQAVAVLIMLAIGQLFVIWVRSVIDKPAQGFSYWTPSIVGMVIWPWLFVVLRDIRRRGNIN